MTFPIIERLRPKISKMYLDWAEKLPKFGGGFIHFLQKIRESDRKEARKSLEKFSAPEDGDIEFLHLRLSEIYNIEQFDELKENLIKLFPTFKEQKFNYGFLTNFEKHVNSIQVGNWQHLGYIIKDESNRFIGMDAYRCISELPKEVDFITIGLRHFLPSTIEIIIDAHLNKSATKIVSNVQKSFYLPKVEFNNLLPWNLRQGHSGNFSEAVRIEKVTNTIEGIRVSIEKCLKPYISGYFSKQNKSTNLYQNKLRRCVK